MLFPTGFIGKIKLAIPWNKLNSAPWTITLEKLYVVAGPVTDKKVVASMIFNVVIHDIPEKGNFKVISLTLILCAIM